MAQPRIDPIVQNLLDEAELRRQQEAEACKQEAERARRLNEHAAYRRRLENAVNLAHAFPHEENQQGRKPCANGFRHWAERFLSVGTILRECDEAIERLDLAERLSLITERSTHQATKFACALLLMASEGGIDDVASGLEKANGDWELRRFVLWLPFILDHLWLPFPDKRGHILVADYPDGTTKEEMEQVHRAFGLQTCGMIGDPAGSTDWTSEIAEDDEGAAPQPTAPLSAKCYLFNWPEILGYLQRPNTEKERRRVRRLNDECDGPLNFEGQGSGPKVDKVKLMEWWNGLEDRWEELQRRKADQRETVKEQYEYGKNATVVPNVSGQVKRRKKPQS
jgi:hypothetical protein